MGNVVDLEHKKFISVGQGNVRVAVDAIITNQPIETTDAGVKGDVVNEFGEASAVTQGSNATIVSYVVPAGKTFRLKLVEFDGTNIARFEVLVDNILQGKKRTYFGGDVSGQFDFSDKKFGEGTTITLRVNNFRPDNGDYAGRIVGVLND